MVGHRPPKHFLSCDWGTSRLRIRLVNRAALRVVAEHSSDQGAQLIASAHPPGDERRRAFETTFAEAVAILGAIAHDPVIPAIISGMASANLGWEPLPYANLPAFLDGRNLVLADRRLDGRHIRFVSGVRAEQDVMRGEETELVGLFAAGLLDFPPPGAVVVLPGTHSKHVDILAGRIVAYRTHLTGELYAVLRQHSTIGGDSTPAHDSEAFTQGLQAASEYPLTEGLFQTRARTILGTLTAAGSASFLSGILIASEILSLPAEDSRPVLLAVGDSFAEKYRAAFSLLRPKRVLHIVPARRLAETTVRAHALLLPTP